MNSVCTLRSLLAAEPGVARRLIDASCLSSSPSERLRVWSWRLRGRALGVSKGVVGAGRSSPEAGVAAAFCLRFAEAGVEGGAMSVSFEDMRRSVNGIFCVWYVAGS